MDNKEKEIKSNRDKNSSETIENKVSVFREDPFCVIATYSDIFISLAQLRCKECMLQLEIVRQYDRERKLSENIQAIEDNIRAMLSPYELVIQQTMESYGKVPHQKCEE